MCFAALTRRPASFYGRQVGLRFEYLFAISGFEMAPRKAARRVALGAILGLCVCATGTAFARDASTVLSTRPFPPADLSKQSTHWYPNAPAMQTATGPGPSDEQAAAMLDAYFAGDPSNGAAAHGVFDSAAARQKVPAPAARAALAGLEGTIGQPAIDYILNAQTPDGRPKVTGVVFADLADLVYAQSVASGDGQKEIRLNNDYTAANPFLFTSLLAHEALHQDEQSGSTFEELSATSFEGLIYMRQLVTHPELANAPTGLARFQNTAATLRLNSGQGATLGLYSSNGGQPILPGSNSNATSYLDAFDKAFVDTAGNALLGSYLAATHGSGAPACSGDAFSQALLDCIDANGDSGLTPDELIAAANAIGLDTSAGGSSEACDRATAKLKKDKAKLKKLRQHHASKEAIRKVKKRVAADKAAVRDACA
jgi:hypothetical protein